VPGLDEQLKIQEQTALWLRQLRHQQGALDLESLESHVVFDGDRVASLQVEPPNRAHWLIENFMIAANGVVARFLESKGRPSLRRVVRSPERWAKIVAVAAEYGDALPAQPSAAELELFLARRRAADPVRFPDLSLVIVKLMGRGEYVAEAPGETPVGHFGLAVRDYSHSTAPNRRFPDLVIHRLIKAALADRPSPFTVADLSMLGGHCTLQEANANKVERQVRKSAAALLLQDRLGQVFDGIITPDTFIGTRTGRSIDGHRKAASRATSPVGSRCRAPPSAPMTGLVASALAGPPVPARAVDKTTPVAIQLRRGPSDQDCCLRGRRWLGKHPDVRGVQRGAVRGVRGATGCRSRTAPAWSALHRRPNGPSRAQRASAPGYGRCSGSDGPLPRSLQPGLP
jgi:hypothetical protein